MTMTTITTVTPMIMPTEGAATAGRDDDLALLGLLQLVSPALPIGAFAFSQGLESAFELCLTTCEERLEPQSGRDDPHGHRVGVDRFTGARVSEELPHAQSQQPAGRAVPCVRGARTRIGPGVRSARCRLGGGQLVEDDVALHLAQERPPAAGRKERDAEVLGVDGQHLAGDDSLAFGHQNLCEAEAPCGQGQVQPVRCRRLDDLWRWGACHRYVVTTSQRDARGVS